MNDLNFRLIRIGTVPTEASDAISVLKGQILALEKEITLVPSAPTLPEEWEPNDKSRLCNTDPRK